ncbi:MAG: hypothetical protein PHT15_00480 [Gallionellaceae bacterium]|nr:hypothetical protein [Gallionellaceae bacterium]
MLKLLIKTLGFIACLTLSGVACAVGMGGINVISALGEPLKAEIELVAVGKAEKNSLSAHLASPDVFKGAGIDFPSALPKLKFQIDTRDNGDFYLKMTSVQPVNEPFVSLLVELSWSSGRLLREYTFLLDPPGYRPELPKAVEVQPVPSKVEAQVEPSTAAPVHTTELPRTAAPVTEKIPVASTPAVVSEHAESSNVAMGVIKVKRGDTLSKIAREAKPSEISLERMLVALYRANADAFDGKNMNRLKTGKILHMPEQSDLDKLAQVDAVKEIRVQVADWHAYRQKLAAASTAVTEHAPKQEASGKISTTVAEKAPAAKEPAREVVRLSKGEAPGDKAGAGGNAKSLQEKAHAMEEEAIAKKKALKEGNERIALLEKNAKDMQRLIELKSKPVAPSAKPEPAKVEAKPPMPVTVSSVAATASGVAPASAVKPAKPAAKPVVAPKVVAPPPSLLDEPLYLAGGAAALLAMGGLGFVLVKRRRGGKASDKKSGDKEPKEVKEDMGSKTSTRISAPVASSPETGDFTHAAAATTSQMPPEDVDPISEADLFLNFGRDAQAEDILKDALEKNPANNQVRLKLLSIYANRKDTKQFSSIARQVQDSGDAAAWVQAAEMGRGMEPNNPMYGGAGDESTAPVMEQVKSEQQPAAGLDFDLGFVAPETAATPEGEGTVALAPSLNTSAAAPLDFDLGFSAPEAAAIPENEGTVISSAPLGDEFMATPAAEALQETQMDFDITSTHPSLAAIEPGQDAAIDFDVTASRPSFAATEPEQAAAATPNLDDLVFDITSTHPSLTAVTEENADFTPSGNDGAMEFTLDFPTADKPEAVPAQAAAKEASGADLGSISLNFDEPAAPASAPAAAKDAHWHDIATKLDLAKAYQEMGDNAGAREILGEVQAEGDEQQRAAADAILQQLLA